MTIKFEIEAEALNEMTTSELEELFKSNHEIREKFSMIADEALTDWDIADRFRNCPAGIDEDGYCRLMFDHNVFCYYSRNSAGEVFPWMRSYLADYYPSALDKIAEDGIELDRIEKYIDVLTEDGCYINLKQKDFDYMDGKVREVMNRMLGYIQGDYDGVRMQFWDDDYYLADALLSCGLVDDFYLVNGELYEIDEDETISRKVA